MFGRRRAARHAGPRHCLAGAEMRVARRAAAGRTFSAGRLRLDVHDRGPAARCRRARWRSRKEPVQGSSASFRTGARSSPTHVPRPDRQALQDLAERASARGLIIGLENEHACNVGTGVEAGRVLASARSSRAQAHLGPGERASPRGERRSLTAIRRSRQSRSSTCTPRTAS